MNYLVTLCFIAYREPLHVEINDLFSTVTMRVELQAMHNYSFYSIV